MSPLNPTLFTALTAKFGPPRISNPHEKAQRWTELEYVKGRPRRSERISGGEYYLVNCPYCNDGRSRLQFSHLWATRRDASPGLLMHLVHCFNEGCIDSAAKQEQLYDLIFPDGAAAAAPPVSATEPQVYEAAVTHFSLPAGTTPLSSLPPDHAALKYLESRNFNVSQLERWWGVEYCALNYDSRPRVIDRLVIPIIQTHATPIEQSQLRGWQARTIKDISGSPKYLTAAGMSKTGVLYGLPRAGTGDEVLIVVEGVTDVWRLGSNAVATLGKSISDRQRQLMLAHFRGRPVLVAYDADASSEADKVRNQLLADRRAVGDDAPVVTLQLPAGVDDVGECSHNEIWAKVADCLERALGGPLEIAGRMPQAARIYSVDGAAKCLTSRAIQQLGGTVMIAHDESADKQSVLTLRGVTGGTYHVLRPSHRWHRRLAHVSHVYDDLLASLSIARKFDVPNFERFDDVRTIRQLLGDEMLTSAKNSSLVRTERAHQDWTHGRLRERLHDEGLDFIYEHIEKPLLGTVAAMMSTGVHIDQDALGKLIASTSPADRSKQRTSVRVAGKASCDGLLAAAKRLRCKIDPATGRVQTSLDPLGAVTGRFSDSSPNLLTLDERLKRVVAAPSGRLLIQADYREFELRVAAQLSQDEAWLAAIARGDDLHRLTAAELFDVSTDNVTDEQRNVGKLMNLAVLNGAQSTGLAKVLKTKKEDGDKFRRAFAEHHPEFTEWAASVREAARMRGYSRTLWGRRRRLKSPREDWLAVNSIVQGTGADLFKMALVRLHNALPPRAKLLLPIHDAVLMEVDSHDLEHVAVVLRCALTELPEPFAVPLDVKIEAGENWLELYPLEEAVTRNAS
jgi:hypothetical protein